jgi:ribosomal-protein-alanine N-acetyltransferase
MVKTTDRPDTVMPLLRRSPDTATRSDWREGLPVLRGRQIVLREIRESDAASLMALLSTEEVSRFIWEPPSSVEVLEAFIARARAQRAAGACACYVVTLKGLDTAIGLFQIREVTPGLSTAEWGFVIASDFWGTGVFAEAASLVLEFVFDTLRSHRLEARSATRNGRGHAALRKLGAVEEGVLRKSLARDGRYLDQTLYAIIADEWRAAHPKMSQGRVH